VIPDNPTVSPILSIGCFSSRVLGKNPEKDRKKQGHWFKHPDNGIRQNKTRTLEKSGVSTAALSSYVVTDIRQKKKIKFF